MAIDKGLPDFGNYSSLRAMPSDPVSFTNAKGEACEIKFDDGQFPLGEDGRIRFTFTKGDTTKKYDFNIGKNTPLYSKIAGKENGLAKGIALNFIASMLGVMNGQESIPKMMTLQYNAEKTCSKILVGDREDNLSELTDTNSPSKVSHLKDFLTRITAETVGCLDKINEVRDLILGHSSHPPSVPSSVDGDEGLTPLSVASRPTQAPLFPDYIPSFKNQALASLDFLNHGNLMSTAANSIFDKHVKEMDEAFADDPELLRRAGNLGSVSSEAFIHNLQDQGGSVNQRVASLLRGAQDRSGITVSGSPGLKGISQRGDSPLAIREDIRTNSVPATERFESYFGKIQNKLESLAIGEKMIMDGGVPGHQMYYAFKKEEDETFTLTIYNSGLGCDENHSNFEESIGGDGDNTKINVCMFLEKQKISLSKMKSFVKTACALNSLQGENLEGHLEGLGLEKPLKDILKNNNIVKKQEALNRINFLYNQVGLLSSKEVTWPDREDPIGRLAYRTRQRGGTCTEESLDAIHHHEFLLEGGFKTSSSVADSNREDIALNRQMYKISHLNKKVIYLIESFQHVKAQGFQTGTLDRSFLISILRKTKNVWEKRQSLLSRAANEKYESSFSEIQSYLDAHPAG
ncbi:MAG: hypothetical protein ACI9YB_002237 [Halioglobus sp.]|jgi:hypothetical protein